MQNQGLLKNILLEISVLKLYILTENRSFFDDETTNSQKGAIFGEGGFQSFFGGKWRVIPPDGRGVRSEESGIRSEVGRVKELRS